MQRAVALALLCFAVLTRAESSWHPHKFRRHVVDPAAAATQARGCAHVGGTSQYRLEQRRGP